MDRELAKKVLVGLALAAPVQVVLVVAWPDDPDPVRRARPAEDEVDMGEIGPGDAVEVAVPGRGAVVFVVVGSGDPVTVRAEGNGFDSTLTAIDADGDQLAYNDDTNGLDPLVRLELASEEEARVELRSLAGDPGTVTVFREDGE